MPRKPWNKYERWLLELHFPLRRTEWIARQLGRTYCSVVAQAAKMGLRKSEWFLQSDLNGRLKGDRGKYTRFQKGQTTWNKGKLYDAGGRSAETRFKPGHLPATTLHDGAITIRHDKRGVPYQHIRVDLGVWVPLHVHRWREAHGKIPRRHCIVFRDGDTLNCDLENLECISREEHMRRNTIHRYPAEVKTAIRAFKKLEKAISHAKKQAE
jgi:hypothetical protein